MYLARKANWTLVLPHFSVGLPSKRNWRPFESYFDLSEISSYVPAVTLESFIAAHGKDFPLLVNISVNLADLDKDERFNLYEKANWNDDSAPDCYYDHFGLSFGEVRTVPKSEFAERSFLDSTLG